ncbi:nicotinate (nicotinamide) nucleotide adenylyltransferase [Pseudorhodoferax sp. Leaf265]|uniref:nicotinate (nicotinamide) nucleotide adenylyltransferase n=1 Tax=Pseudorhodoferax sp. Leaf265 TaxID=1736315 RepID=UPI001F027300|nr:nicotinate (nicotinamide) nucleotide adenylyltransferase [Pseudorhodoferax sp. Leaf265]
MDLSDASLLRVGVYGGAFDPPHNTHVDLVRAAMARWQLDRLHVLPTGQPWHRPRQPTDAVHRLVMAELAFEGIPGVVVDAREIERTGPSYTVDSLRELQIGYPRARLHLLIGSDQARALTSWHAWQEIVKLATLCVAARVDDAAPQGQVPDLALPGATIDFLQTVPVATSATEIRQRVAAGQGIAHLVPPAVAGYIDQHHLYRTAR